MLREGWGAVKRKGERAGIESMALSVCMGEGGLSIKRIRFDIIGEFKVINFDWLNYL